MLADRAMQQRKDIANEFGRPVERTSLGGTNGTAGFAVSNKAALGLPTISLRGIGKLFLELADGAANIVASDALITGAVGQSPNRLSNEFTRSGARV
jgi:hypothetical protein